jgi:hypothetical protein
VPFLRFSRDKRGYESVYLVQPETNRRGKTRTRVLYWYRTPPGLKVGRQPFDQAAQRALEAQNPGIVFDWPKIVSTPMPPPAPDVERWRERRRLERAAKQAAREEAAATGASSTEASASGEAADATEALGEEAPLDERGSADAAGEATPSVTASSPESSSEHQGPPDSAPTERRRRRRRRRGGGNRSAGPTAE